MVEIRSQVARAPGQKTCTTSISRRKQTGKKESKFRGLQDSLELTYALLPNTGLSETEKKNTENNITSALCFVGEHVRCTFVRARIRETHTRAKGQNQRGG